MEKNKQHFVPQFYLKKFSNNNKSVGMYLFNGNKFVEHASIKEVAYRKHLYGKDNSIENILANDEGLWNSIIEKIIQTKSIQLSEEEYVHLMMFITITEARTSLTADYTNKEINDLYDLLYYLETGNKKTLKVEYDIPNLRPLKSAINITPVLLDLETALIINNSNRGFITSDNPVVRYNQFFVFRRYFRSYGYGHVGIQIFLPLSPEICLCVYDRIMYKPRTENTIIVKSGSQINELNKLFILNAYQSIFFNNSEKNSYIKSVIRHRKENLPFHFPVLGGGDRYIFQTSHPSIHDSIKLDFFSINPDLIDSALPANAAGPLRPDVKEHIEKQKRETGEE